MILQALQIGGCVAGAALGLFSYGTFVPGARLWGNIISHGTRQNPPRVALTFDDGPTAGATDRVLDLLGELNVKASFFVIGRNVEREPALLQRIDAEGHLVGNHTYDHSRWSSTAHAPYWAEQIDKTNAAIQRVLGKTPRLFRPPIGHKTPFTMMAVRRHRQVMVTWSIRGWDGIPTTPDKIVARILPRSRAGSIILLHDGIEPSHPRDPAPTIAAVRPLIESLRQRGLEPVRLDELTGLEAYADTRKL